MVQDLSDPGLVDFDQREQSTNNHGQIAHTARLLVRARERRRRPRSAGGDQTRCEEVRRSIARPMGERREEGSWWIGGLAGRTRLRRCCWGFYGIRPRWQLEALASSSRIFKWRLESQPFLPSPTISLSSACSYIAGPLTFVKELESNEMSDVISRMFVKATKTSCMCQSPDRKCMWRVAEKAPTMTGGPKYGELHTVSKPGRTKGFRRVGRRLTCPALHPGAVLVSHRTFCLAGGV
jgi:hypothetical protein